MPLLFYVSIGFDYSTLFAGALVYTPVVCIQKKA